MTRIVAPRVVQEMLPLAGPGPSIVRTSPAESAYAAIYARHYTRSRGAIGRQLHYLVRLDGRVLGIVAAGEPMFRCRPRDRWLRRTFCDDSLCADGAPPPRWLVACAAFRVENAPHGLATAVLALWRLAVAADWRDKYGDDVRAFETTVGPPRSGACFRHDGWQKVGYTTGRGARRPDGHGHAARVWIDTGERKMVLVRKNKP